MVNAKYAGMKQNRYTIKITQKIITLWITYFYYVANATDYFIKVQLIKVNMLNYMA